MKNRVFATGVLLLGIAAIGKVALSWVDYNNESRREKEKQELQHQQEQAVRERQAYLDSLIKSCNAEASHAAAEVMKAGSYMTGDINTIYKEFYTLCLRKSGLEPEFKL